MTARALSRDPEEHARMIAHAPEVKQEGSPSGLLGGLADANYV